MFISNWPNKAEKEGKFFFKRKKGNNRMSATETRNKYGR